MKPVNLLPEGERPHVPSGRRQGSSYVVVGALAVVLVALVSYVLVANQVTSRTAEAEQASKDADAAEAEAAKLGAFGSFAKIKEARESAVKSTAQERFDWERLSLEMARVVPTDVFITEVDASVKPDAAGKSSGGSAGASTAGAGAGASDGPSMELVGCAVNQKDVATTMVRLRALHRAQEVTLAESTREEATDAPAGGSAPSGGGAASSGPQGCGTTNFKPNYKFTLNVAFEKAAPSEPRRPAVPSSLGGGA